jgi:hypothetical protein
MPDSNLRIGIEVNTNPLVNFAEASRQVASNCQVMATQFVASGMSAKEAASALENLGFSAKEAAIATGTFASAAGKTAKDAQAAAASIGAMDRALASGAIRIAASEAGLGQLGFAFARVGAASATVAPLLAVAFPVVAAVAFVSIIDSLVEKFAEWRRAEDLVTIGWNNLSLGMLRDVDRANAEFAKLNEKFIGLTQGPLAELQAQLAHVAISFDLVGSASEHAFGEIDKGLKLADTSKWNPLAWLNFLRDAKIGTADLQPLADKIQISLQEALRSKDPEKIFAALDAGLRQMAAKEKEIQDTLNKTVEGDISIPYYQKKLQAIHAITEALQDLQRLQVEADAAADKERGIKGVEVQKEQTKELEKSANAALMLWEALNRIQGKEESIAMAAKSLATEQATWGAEQAAREAAAVEKTWLDVARARIEAEQEVFRESQKNAEDQMRNARAQQSLATAGMGKGPITSVMDTAALQEQASIAQAAMDKAKEAAADYKAQLNAVEQEMVRLDTSTADGAARFKELETQMRELQKLFDSSKDAVDRWNVALTQIATQTKTNALVISWQTLGTTIAQAGNVGLNSFNANFTKMLEGGMSFTRLMQSAWTAMVNSFIQGALRMAEEWIAQFVIMAGVRKIMAAIAGAGGTASMAAAPFPIDTTAPAFGAAMEAASMAFSFAEGGIVRANLHAGEMVLPANLSAFVQQSAAAAVGGAGGPGGQGGPGGPGGAAGHTFHYHDNRTGDSREPAGKDFMKQVERELRRRNLR